MFKNKFFKKSSPKVLKGGEVDSHEPVQAQHLEVKVFHDQFDRAFRAFRTLVQKDGILSVYKEKQRYEKPSDKRRRKRNEHKRKLFELEMSKRFHKESK